MRRAILLIGLAVLSIAGAAQAQQSKQEVLDYMHEHETSMSVALMRLYGAYEPSTRLLAEFQYPGTPQAFSVQRA